MFILGATSGPLVGLFFLGIFFPHANRNGAWLSMLLSTALLVMFAIASQVEKPYDDYVLVDRSPFAGRDAGRCMAEEAVWANSTAAYLQTKSPHLHFGHPDSSWFARLSPYCYSSLGLALVVLLGVPISWLLPQKGMSEEVKRVAYACTYQGLAEPLEERWQQRVEEEEKQRPKLSLVEVQEKGRLLMGFVE